MFTLICLDRTISLIIVMAGVMGLSLGAAPVLSPFTAPYNLHEDTTTETQLSQITCTDADVGDACLCNLGGTNPSGGPFQVWRKNGLTSYSVYYLGVTNGQALSFSATPTWEVQVSCTDTTNSATVTTNLEVDIQPNQTPVFTNTNYPRETISLNVDTPIVASTTVFTVTATDAEDDSLSFSIISSPDVGYFEIGSSDGNINTLIDLRSASESIITLTVTVSDGQNTASGFDIVITLTNVNTAPDIINLPATVTLDEDTANNAIIFTMTVSDPDVFGTSTDPVCTITPEVEDYKFSFDTGNLRIRTASLASGATLFDYELTAQYIISCTVSDGFRSSTGEVLTIDIDNVNEAPEFDEIAYYCDLTESNAGVSTCDINAVITDPEGDSITSVSFMNGNNSERFRYDRSTTTITFNVDYDVDSSAMPTSVTLQLSAVDNNGLAGTVPVYFTISDANDNTCDFGGTSALRVSADQGTSLGNVGTFIATDGDLRSPNNDVTYELASSSPADALNYINVFSDGRVEYTSLIPESNHGTSYSLTVRCKDGGSPSLTAEATFILSYVTTTTVTTTTTTTTTTTATTTEDSSSDDPFSNDAFVAVFVILITLLILGLLVGLYFCLKACGMCGGTAAAAAGVGGGGAFGNMCNGCCMPREPPPQKVKPYEPPEVYRPERTNDFYAERSWKTGDHYEDGRIFGSRGSAAVTLHGGHRALPAPRQYRF